MNAKDTRMIRQTADAMRELLPRNRVESGVGRPSSSSTRIRISGHDCFHSMGGAGKHLRPIALESWQREIVERHPEDFVRAASTPTGVATGESFVVATIPRTRSATAPGTS
jgi:hypothetical protein